jgi:hypothetical protein
MLRGGAKLVIGRFREPDFPEEASGELAIQPRIEWPERGGEGATL